MAIALLFGLLTTLANVAGSALAILREHPSRSFMASAIGFSGGFMLAAAFLEMGPEAISRGAYVPPFIALGFLLLYLTEHLFNVHIHNIPGDHEEVTDGESSLNSHPNSVGASPRTLIPASTGITAYAAFNLHDLIDGLAIGSAMITSQAVGILVFFAVLLHEVPAGFTVAVMLRSAGKSRIVALLSGVSIGVVTLIGITIPFLLGDISDTITGAFLGLATGSFIYLGASILIPAAETGGYRWSFLFVAVGFVAFWVSSAGLGIVISE